MDKVKRTWLTKGVNTIMAITLGSESLHFVGLRDERPQPIMSRRATTSTSQRRNDLHYLQSGEHSALTKPSSSPSGTDHAVSGTMLYAQIFGSCGYVGLAGREVDACRGYQGRNERLLVTALNV